MESFTIGQVARKTGVGIETIRYYEREGLIQNPPRKQSGYRQFPQDVIARIRFIKQAKKLGFTLREIKELLDLRVDPFATCEEVKECALAKIGDITQKIKELQRMKKALQKLTAACDGKGSSSDCPILEALDSEDIS